MIEHITINADDLLPSARRAYRYDGSLTTPPCSEGVKWLVLTTPIELSEVQPLHLQPLSMPTIGQYSAIGRKLLVDKQKIIEKFRFYP